MSEKFLYFGCATSIVGLMLLGYAAQVLEPPVVGISGIDSRLLAKNVHISGVVDKVVSFDGGGEMLKVSDDTGSIDVYLNPRVARHLNVSEGHTIDVVGSVEFYEDEIEIVPNSYKHLRVLGYFEPPLLKISDINTTVLEKKVRVRGNVSDVKKFRGGSVIWVAEDDTGSIDVYLNSNIAGRFNITEGAEIGVTGRVELYEGELEVKVESYEDIRIFNL